MARLAHLLLDPLAILWLILLAMLIWQIRRKQFRWAYINGLIVMSLLLSAGMPLSKRITATLEKPYYRASLDDVPVADAVVVLGGFVQAHSGPEEAGGIDFNEAVDRLVAGVELLHRGKARHLVLGGGQFGPRSAPVPDAVPITQLLQRWGIGERNVTIHSTGICANTREEAQRVAEMMARNQWTRVDLVTSAWHMRRALAVFRSAGVDAIPVACDFVAYPLRESWWSAVTVLPESAQLLVLHRYLHEQVGWWYYRARGWITPGVSVAP